MSAEELQARMLRNLRLLLWRDYAPRRLSSDEAAVWIEHMIEDCVEKVIRSDRARLVNHGED